jgi:hypothetical protein
MMNLGALVTVMIATSGDESFVMFAMFPGKALLIHLLLFAVAILAGYLVNLFNKSRPLNSPLGFKIHESDYCKCFTIDIIIPQLKRITFERTLLLLFTLVFGLLLGLGIVGSDVWDMGENNIYDRDGHYAVCFYHSTGSFYPMNTCMDI